MATATDQPATKLLTIEDYLALPDDGRMTELVLGRVVEVVSPGFEHGDVCGEIFYQIKHIIKRTGAGRVVTNDTSILIRRDPDTLRGADVAYFSAAKVPPPEQRRGVPPMAPDLVVEVRSPSDTWVGMLAKASEYIEAGVIVVVLLDPQKRSAWVIREDEEPLRLGSDDELTVPDLLPEFRVRVGAIFE